MPSTSGTIIAERLLSEREDCTCSLAELDDGSRVIIRRVRVEGPPSIQARIDALHAVERAGLSGFVEIVGVRALQDGIEIREALVEGFSLDAAIEPVQQHVTVNVALALVHEVARSLARLHALAGADGRPAGLVHGRLTLADILISRRGETRLAGLFGQTGDVREDVEALMAAMRTLLATRAINPKGSALLDRLAELKFGSCVELARAIEVYLARQDPDELASRRRRFTSAVLTVHRDPRIEAPFADEETTIGALDEGLEAQILRGGGEALALGIAMPTPTREDSIPSLDPAELEIFSDQTSESSPLDPIPAYMRAPDTAETAAEMLPEGFLEDVLGMPEGGFGARADEMGIDSFGPGGLELDPDPDPTEAGVVDDDAREGLLASAAPAEEVPPPSGERPDSVQVGDYRVVASIGRGGMGEIYLGREVKEGRLGRLVALKVMGQQGNLLEQDEQALDMLLDEAKIMAHIQHPNVLRVVDFGKAHGRYFLATEYLEGRPLVRVMIDAYAKAEGLDYATIACIGSGAAHGLHAAHSAVSAEGAPLEVVHRDVSPQNIFVTYAGDAKVIDFGVARATERIAKTAVGLVKGKAAYMSPEQSEGRQVDARSDVFSLGVCLWEMTAGCRLFKRDIEYDTLLAVQSAPIEPPSVVRGDPNPVLDHIILSALARDRDRRTQTARDLAEQLDDYVRGVGVTSKEETIAELLEGLFGEAKEKEQALIRSLELRSATPEEVAQLEALSGVSPHEKRDFKQITLVGAPDALSDLDDFGSAQVIRAVDAAQAEREGPPFEISVELDATGEVDATDETPEAEAEPPDEPTQDDGVEEFDIMPTARLPDELVSQVRAELRPSAPRPPTPVSLVPPESGIPASISALIREQQAPPLEEDGAFEPVLPAPATVPADPATGRPAPAPPPVRRTSRLVVGLIAATCVALAVAAVLLWQMLPEAEDRGPTVALRTSAPAEAERADTATVAPTVQNDLRGAAPAAAEAGAVAEAEEAPEPALVDDSAPDEAAERKVAQVPEPEAPPKETVAPKPEAAPAAEVAKAPAPEPAKAPEVAKAPEPVKEPEPAPAPRRDDSTVVPAAATSPTRPAQSSLQSMLAALRAKGLDVSKAGATYLVDDGAGGSVVVDERAKITPVRSGASTGYLVRARAAALTSVSWVGTVGQGAWRARGLSVNDCPATVKTSPQGLVLSYGKQQQRLPWGGGVLFDVAVAVPPGATSVQVEPLGIVLGKGDGKPGVRCRSGWWGKQVVLRRLPPGRYELRWTGAEGKTEAVLSVSEAGVDNGEIKRVRRPS